MGFLRGPYRLGGTGAVINHAFGSLSGQSSLADPIDWGHRRCDNPCFWKPLRPQFPRGPYRLGGTGDVINYAFGSLSGHSSLEDPIDSSVAVMLAYRLTCLVAGLLLRDQTAYLLTYLLTYLLAALLLYYYLTYLITYLLTYLLLCCCTTTLLT